MVPRHARVTIALGLVVMTGSLGSSATARSADPAVPFEPTGCIGGSAVTTIPSTSVPLVVGTCHGPGGGAVDGSPEGGGPVSGGASMLPDCQVPGFDDRCEAWTAPRYDGPWGGDDWAGFGSIDRVDVVVPTPDGRLVIVGGTSTYTSGGGPEADFVNVAYSAETGLPVWTSTWEGDGDRFLAYESSIALSKDGETLFALGLVAGSDYSYSSYVLALDAATGRELWHWRAPIYAASIATGEVTLPDGTVEPRLYLAGFGGFDGRLAGVVAAVDPSDRDLLWRSSNPDPEGLGSLFNDLAVSPDGSTVFATGGDFREDGLRRNFATAAYRTDDGEALWASRDERTQPDGFYGINGASDLVVSADGSRVYIAGFDPVSGSDLVDQNDTYSGLVTVARDAATGEIAWRRTYLGPVEGERHFYFSLFMPLLEVTPDDATVVATGGLGQEGSGTVAYEAATGTQRWGIESVDPVGRSRSIIGFYPTLAMSRDGSRVFVTNSRGAGFSTTSFVTQAYSVASGATQWTARFTTNVSYPAGIATSIDGSRIFVTGVTKSLDTVANTSQHTRDSLDIQTVAYAAG